MKSFFIAIQTKEGEKYYAYVLRVSESDNLKCKLDSINNLVSANICKTKKEAVRLVDVWNTENQNK